MAEAGAWRRCSACKSPIGLGETYWVCSVSTCNRKRTGLVFCTVSCWEVHLPSARHREAWAVERQAPATAEEPSEAPRVSGAAPRPSGGATASPAAGAGRRRLVRPEPSRPKPEIPREILVVASRLKDYVRARSGGYNTSDGVLEPLSDILRRAVDEAIGNAQRDGRRTVLARDIPERD